MAAWRGVRNWKCSRAEHGLKIGSIADLIAHRLATEHTVERVDEREIDTEFEAVPAGDLPRPHRPRPALRPGPRHARCGGPDAGTGAGGEPAGRPAALAPRRFWRCRQRCAARDCRRRAGRDGGAVHPARRVRLAGALAAAAGGAAAEARTRMSANGGATAPVRRSWPTSGWASCGWWAHRGGRSAWPATAWRSSRRSSPDGRPVPRSRHKRPGRPVPR